MILFRILSNRVPRFDETLEIIKSRHEIWRNIWKVSSFMCGFDKIIEIVKSLDKIWENHVNHQISWLYLMKYLKISNSVAGFDEIVESVKSSVDFWHSRLFSSNFRGSRGRLRRRGGGKTEKRRKMVVKHIKFLNFYSGITYICGNAEPG